MAHMSFETKQDWNDFKDKMDEAMWGVFAKDAPEGGYWELVYFTKFLSRLGGFSSPEDVLTVLEKPYKWYDEYVIFKKFQKKVDGETDAETLHAMMIWDFAELDTAMDDANFKDRYMENLSCW